MIQYRHVKETMRHCMPLLGYPVFLLVINWSDTGEFGEYIQAFSSPSYHKKSCIGKLHCVVKEHLNLKIRNNIMYD